MKVSLEKAKELFKLFGVDVELVADDKAADKDVDIETLYDEALASIKEASKSELKDSILKDEEPGIHAKHINTMRSVIQRELGIPKKDLEDMKIEDIVKHIKANMEGKTKSEAGEWEQKYKQLLQDSDSEKEALETTWQTKYDNDLKTANQKYLDFHIDSAYVKHVSNMPRQGGDAVKQARVLRQLAKSEGYEEVYDEATGAFSMKKGGKVVKVEDELKNLAKDILPLAKDTKHINPREVSNGNKQGSEEGVKQIEGSGFGDFGAVAAWSDSAA